MIHHGWLPGEVDTSGSTRRMFLDRVVFDDDGLPRRDDSEVSGASSDSSSEGGSYLTALILGLVVGGGALLARRRGVSGLTNGGSSDAGTADRERRPN